MASSMFRIKIILLHFFFCYSAVTTEGLTHALLSSLTIFLSSPVLLFTLLQADALPNGLNPHYLCVTSKPSNLCLLLSWYKTPPITCSSSCFFFNEDFLYYPLYPLPSLECPSLCFRLQSIYQHLIHAFTIFCSLIACFLLLKQTKWGQGFSFVVHFFFQNAWTNSFQTEGIKGISVKWMN